MVNEEGRKTKEFKESFLRKQMDEVETEQKKIYRKTGSKVK